MLIASGDLPRVETLAVYATEIDYCCVRSSERDLFSEYCTTHHGVGDYDVQRRIQRAGVVGDLL